MLSCLPFALNALPLLLLASLSIASIAGAERPELLFREDWKETPAAIPVTQAHVTNSELTLHLHGPSKDLIKKSHHDQPADDPFYVWSGLCVSSNWAVSLEPHSGAFDLRGQSKVRWRAKQSGFRVLRIIIQLANGDWLVSDVGDPASHDWREREFIIANIQWRKLNMELIAEEHPVITDPDLSRVTQVGFTDLMIGASSRASSRLDWIEVYASSSATK